MNTLYTLVVTDTNHKNIASVFNFPSKSGRNQLVSNIEKTRPDLTVKTFETSCRSLTFLPKMLEHIDIL